jgi:hypothetical protein
VMKRHTLRPSTSEIFPKAGHAINARRPRTHSAHPMTKYMLSPNVCRRRVGMTARVMESARNSRRRTGST